MKTTIIIDGGLGRQITAIPALEKYVKKNPDTIIISHFWTQIVYGNPILQDKIYDVSTKGLFDIVKDSKIIRPEPYYNTDYINGRINLIDAFNQEINQDNEKLSIPKLYLTYVELEIGRNKIQPNHQKVLCFQPFGSTANFSKDSVIDTSIRSLTKDAMLHIIHRMKKANIKVALYDDRQIPFLNYDDVLNMGQGSCRDWAGVIANCHYFLGVDSSGQHIARTFNIPGVVIIGGTNANNISYPDHFTIIEKDNAINKKYMSLRLCDFDYKMSEFYNGDLMNFDKNDIDQICDLVINNINRL